MILVCCILICIILLQIFIHDKIVNDNTWYKYDAKKCNTTTEYYNADSKTLSVSEQLSKMFNKKKKKYDSTRTNKQT
jgi:hypothetical protein